MDFGSALKGANQKQKLKRAPVEVESFESVAGDVDEQGSEEDSEDIDPSPAAKSSPEPMVDPGQKFPGEYYGPEKRTPGETDDTGKRPGAHLRYLKAASGHVPSAYAAAKKAGDKASSSRFLQLMKKTAKGGK